MSEFSRRINIEIMKDEPLTREKWLDRGFVSANVVAATGTEPLLVDETLMDRLYVAYLGRFQPYRWRAVAANNEPIAHGESYFNEADCLNAIALLCGDDTTTHYAPTYGEDRAEKLLRYGATDRKNVHEWTGTPG